MSRKSALTPTLIVIVGFLTICPVLMLVVGSFSEGLGTFHGFTVAKYVEAYTDPELSAILLDTSIFTLGSAAVATLLALFLAYLNTRTDIPFKFFFGIISIIPMMIPHILFSVSWVLLLNPSNGILNRYLMELFGLKEALFNIYSLPGMILVEGLLDLPIAYLILAPAMSAFDVSLEESSRVCGANTLRTLTRVTLPVLRPAISASVILVIVKCLASFAVPCGHRHPGKDLRAGDPHLPDHRHGILPRLREGGRRGDERSRRFDPPGLPVPLPDLRRASDTSPSQAEGSSPS